VNADRKLCFDQSLIAFAGSAKRYIDLAESGDVRGLLAESIKIQAAMERVTKALTNTEVTT
jgi:hypothetical protein